METHLLHRAEDRASESPTGIGAAFVRDVSPPDLDGFRWRIVVSDGRLGGHIIAEMSRSQPINAVVIPVLTLQRIVERKAGAFPRESRVEDLLAAGRLVLRSEDFRDPDFETDLI
jgi:hypothetical protein